MKGLDKPPATKGYKDKKKNKSHSIAKAKVSKDDKEDSKDRDDSKSKVRGNFVVLTD